MNDRIEIRRELLARRDNIIRNLEEKERLGGYIKLKQTRIIPQLNRAIQKIDEGTFGICDDCEESIPAQRLAKALGATRCVDCQREWEKTLST